MIPDKRMTEEDVVAELRDGMTIGIGGWGSRRKPMSLVRAILRSPLKDLTIVSYGGPDVGLLCAAGKVRKAVYGFVSLDTIPLEPHFRVARQSGTIEAMELDEGMLLLGLQAAAWRVPFLPTRAGLGSDILRVMPELETVRSPYPDPTASTRSWWPCRRSSSTSRSIHMNRADQGGNGQFLGPDLYFDDLFAMAADEDVHVAASRSSRPRSFAADGSFHTLRISRLHGRPAWSRRPTAPTSPSARRTTAATRRSRRSTPRPRVARGVGRVQGEVPRRRADEAEYQRG